MNFKQIIERMADSNNVKMGSWCIFVDLGNGFGVKFYHDPMVRDAAMIAQQCANEKNLAPWVGGRIDVRDEKKCFGSSRPSRTREIWSSSDMFWGYLTEIVNTDTNDDDFTAQEWNDICNSLENAGFSTRDCFPGQNIGRLGDGKLVMYDFDPFFNFEQDFYESLGLVDTLRGRVFSHDSTSWSF